MEWVTLPDLVGSFPPVPHSSVTITGVEMGSADAPHVEPTANYDFDLFVPVFPSFRSSASHSNPPRTFLRATWVLLHDFQSR